MKVRQFIIDLAGGLEAALENARKLTNDLGAKKIYTKNDTFFSPPAPRWIPRRRTSRPTKLVRTVLYK